MFNALNYVKRYALYTSSQPVCESIYTRIHTHTASLNVVVLFRFNHAHNPKKKKFLLLQLFSLYQTLKRKVLMRRRPYSNGSFAGTRCNLSFNVFWKEAVRLTF